MKEFFMCKTRFSCNKKGVYTDFFQHLNIKFHLALEDNDNNALNTLAEYDHNDPSNRKRPKISLHLNTLL